MSGGYESQCSTGCAAMRGVPCFNPLAPPPSFQECTREPWGAFTLRLDAASPPAAGHPSRARASGSPASLTELLPVEAPLFRRHPWHHGATVQRQRAEEALSATHASPE